MKSPWLAIALVLATIVGSATTIGILRQADAQVAVDVGAGGWRYGDGYWNYYDPGDKAYYYTDGRHWYTYGDNNAWSVYNFDKGFGKAYVREGYAVPKAGANITLPSHRINVKVR